MIDSGQFDRDLGAMTRDPANADKTAAEILKVHEKAVLDMLVDCNCSNNLKHLIIFAVCVPIWGLICLLPW